MISRFARARGMTPEGVLATGKYRYRFYRSPHIPHGWDAGVLFEETRKTLFCSDLFHHFGNVEPVTTSDLIGPTRKAMQQLEQGPLAGYMLSGMGADVTLIARPNASPVTKRFSSGESSELERGKRRMVLDLKSDADRAQAMDLVAGANALIEGMRPGVMERFGLGPADCAKRNPALVYGRISGWGQSGPLAHAAGHDLNYVALTGLLSLSGRRWG